MKILFVIYNSDEWHRLIAQGWYTDRIFLSKGSKRIAAMVREDK